MSNRYEEYRWLRNDIPENRHQALRFNSSVYYYLIQISVGFENLYLMNKVCQLRYDDKTEEYVSTYIPR